MLRCEACMKDGNLMFMGLDGALWPEDNVDIILP